MKKSILTIAACLAFAQIQAATPSLIESVFEYEAITNAIGDPNQTVIPQTEFVTDIRRLTHEVDSLGTVRYKIVTRVQNNNAPVATGMVDCGCHHNRTNNYIAELLVEPNPGVGPNIVTVIGIQSSRH